MSFSIPELTSAMVDFRLLKGWAGHSPSLTPLDGIRKERKFLAFLRRDDLFANGDLVAVSADPGRGGLRLAPLPAEWPTPNNPFRGDP